MFDIIVYCYFQSVDIADFKYKPSFDNDSAILLYKSITINDKRLYDVKGLKQHLIT